jgi:hypothetical protein
MKQIIVVVFSLLSLSVSSQVSLGYSGHMGLFFPSSMLPSDDGGYLTVKKADASIDTKGKNWNTFRHSITLLKYDKDFKLVKEVKLSGGSNIYSGHYSELKKVGKKYWFIYLEPLENYDMGSIKAIEIDPLTLAIKDPSVIAASTALSHSIPKVLKVYELHFMSGISPSGKFVYLYVRMSDDDYFLCCLNENLNPVWGRKETIDGLKDGGICSLEVDDAGAMYMGYLKKSDLFYSFYSPAGKMSTHEVKLTEGTAKEILFNPVKSNAEVFVSGTYKKGDNCTGVYKGMIDKKGELGAVSTTVFPAAIIEPLDKEGWASSKEKKYGVKPTFTAVPVPLRNGGFGMLAEFTSVTEGTRSNYLHGGSFLYVNFSTPVPLFTRAPKYSLGNTIFEYDFNGVHENGCMYYAYPYDSKMILFYFDNPDNLSRDMALDAKVANASNQVLVAAVIEKDGSIKRQRIVPNSSFTGMPATPGNILVPLSIDKVHVVVSVRL